MRATLIALAAAAIPLADGAAQGRRVTLTPSVGYVAASPLFEHDPSLGPPRFNPFPERGPVEQRDHTRLEVAPAATAGARVSVPVGARWTAYAEGAYGTTEFEYRREGGVYQGGNLVAGRESLTRLGARVTTAAVGISRRVAPARGATVLEAGLGAGLQRFQLRRPECVPRSTLGGFFVDCGEYLGDPDEIRWDATYHVPGAAAHVAVQQRVVGRVGVEGRAGYAVGRADTESFYEDLVPELDEYEAPKRTIVRTVQLSLGVSVGL